MSVLEYGHVEQVLRAAGLAMGPAAFHGALCGSLCAVPDGRAERVAAGMLASAEELAALPPGWLAATAEAVAEALGDGELGFVPLLPEDEAPLPARVRALAGWCDAFLGAYGIAAGEAAGGDPERAGILADLAAIARAAEPGSEDEEEREEDEIAFAELVEYVRIAALYLHAGAGSRTGGKRA